jgi:prenyltransferase beta subunit
LVEFARPVRQGWEWLLQQQNPDGSFFAETSERTTHRFYTHGFCTIALCELLAMTGEETLREPAQRAVDYCVRHQSLRSGGWRYLPDRFSDQSDVSVTGWIVLALKSGQTAGLTIPPETYDDVTKFLDSMMKLNTQYTYR